MHLNDSAKNYFPLVWMFCSRQINKMINMPHKRALRIVLNDHTYDFETLLHKSSGISSHHRNIQILMAELYKIKNRNFKLLHIPSIGT